MSNISQSAKVAPSLRDLQTWMRWVFTDPRGVEGALADPRPVDKTPQARYTEPVVRCLTEIAGKTLEEKTERLSVYAEAYFSRILEALAEDHRLSQHFMGEEAFRAFVADYLKYHPSLSPNISDVGLNLPAFALEHRYLEQLPFLAELLQLENNVIYSFYTDPVPPMDFSKLGSLSEEEWSCLHLVLHPSVFLQETAWNLPELWAAGPQAEIAPEQKPGYLLIFLAATVEVKAISRTEFQILQRSQAGESLMAILSELGDDLKDAFDLTQCFAAWAKNQVVANIEFHRNEET